MKETYEAPVLELKSLIPEKDLALIENGGLQDSITASDTDIEILL